jgi:DNA replication protein DnaC
MTPINANSALTANATRVEISKLANELYLSAFAQFEEHVKPDEPFADNLLTLLGVQHRIAYDNRVNRRVRAAGFPQVKTFDMFEMSVDFLPNLNFDEVVELKTCTFIDDKLDICAIGPAGHGKTHLCIAVAYEAVKRGYSVKFRRASDLINEMSEAKSDKSLKDYIRMMSRCDLLCIDEVGYLNYDSAAVSFLFQIIGARYETRSTFYTSNLEFSKWPTFIGDESLAKAIISRIAHHAILLDMNGPKEWRLEHSQSRHSRKPRF